MGRARSPTLDQRRRLFAPKARRKMGGACPAVQMRSQYVRCLNQTFSLRAAALAGAIAVASALISPLGAAADSSMSIAVMGQQDPAWAGAPLGTSATDSVGSAGCAITAVTMMLRYYGMDTDPGAFNAWLTANGGYANDDQLIWDAVTRYSGGRVAFSGWLGADLPTILAELDAGRPVVAEVSIVGNQHFVLLTGYSADGGIQIDDPWFADTVRLGDRYAGSADIVSIRTFMPADPAGARGHGRVSWLANAVAAIHLSQ
jgi:Peptidase_C39 like family